MIQNDIIMVLFCVNEMAIAVEFHFVFVMPIHDTKVEQIVEPIQR